MYAKWRRITCAFILGLSLWAAPGPAQAADPDVLCSKIRPLFNPGYSTVLGFFAAGGIRCPAGPWTLQLGGIYTQLQAATQPFTILSYQTALSPTSQLLVTGSVNERIGDYLVDRLPEAALQWTPRPEFFIIPAIYLSAGWIDTVVPQKAETSRFGTVVTLSTRPVQVETVTLSGTYQTGGALYGTGQNSSFWAGALNASVPLGLSTSLGLTYFHSEGFGVSPLVYDQVSYDNFAVATLTETLNSNVALSFATLFNINVPGYTGLVRQYTLTYTKLSEGWSIGVGWYIPTNSPIIVGNLAP